MNDICHFRIENSLSDSKVQLEMNISLMFVDLSDNKNFEKGEVPAYIFSECFEISLRKPS